MKKIYYLLLINLLVLPFSCLAYDKTETVFSNLKTNGEVKDTNVSVQLSKLEEGDVLDYSALEKIKNTNGKEKFSRDSEKIVWKSTGNDIYYKGKMNSELPIKVSVKYYLNNEEKEYKELKKSKGHIKIIYHFDNLEYDSSSNMYVPFVTSLVSSLSLEDNSNIEVNNGKVIENGNKAFIAGIAAPGLYSNFKVDEFSELNDIIISFDTKKFAFDDVYIVSSPKLLEDVDLSNLDRVGSVSSSLDALQDGMNQIEEGSAALRDGSVYYSSQMGVFRDALAQVEDGSRQLDEGATLLNSSLTPYYEMIMHYGNVLKNEASEEDLNAVDPDFLQKYQELVSILNENQELLTEAEGKVREFSEMYQANNLGQFSDSEQLIDYYMSQGLDTKEILKLGVCKEVYEYNIKLMQYLDNNNYDVISGFIALINEVEGKAQELYGGTSQISEGLNTLHSALSLLYEKSALLQDGAVQIADSTNLLSSGISKINNEGIHKITEYKNLALDYTNKVKKLKDLSSNYSGFSADNVDNTIFIYKLS